MTLLDELLGSSVEALSVLRRGPLGSIAGRPCNVCVDAVQRAKPLATGTAPVGFMPTVSAPFYVAKRDLQGHTVDSLLNQLMTFEGSTYRITKVTDNGLTFALETEAETTKR